MRSLLTWVADAVFFPESRNAYARLLEQGWTGAVGRVHAGRGIYTYWNFSLRGGYDRSSGLRMDHLQPFLDKRTRDAGVDAYVRGWDKPSDHAPAWIELHVPSPAEEQNPSLLIQQQAPPGRIRR
jgi:exodeoxyribonuclease-3